MQIRSQDKKTIVNLDNVARIEVQRINEDTYNINAGYNFIGAYAAEEKAIKVLDMIQDAYNAIETMKIDKCAWRDNHFFNMPSDEEVEVKE